MGGGASHEGNITIIDVNNNKAITKLRRVDLKKMTIADCREKLQIELASFSFIDETGMKVIKSEERHLATDIMKANTTELCIKLENNPRVKKDFDKIYFLLDYDLAKFLVPIFRSYLINTDFYSTSEIILNVSNIKELNDFEGMLIPSHEYFFKQVSNKKEILNLNDEYNKALINDLLTAEKLKRLNVNAIDVIFETSPAVFNNSECIKRDLSLWRVTLNNFTDRS